MKKSELYLDLSRLYAELAEITRIRNTSRRASSTSKWPTKNECPCVKSKAKVLKELIKEHRRLK